MFTGIISKTSKVKNIKKAKSGLSLEILNSLGKASGFSGVKPGASISLNGVCSTVKKTGKALSFEYMPETLKLSNLGNLKKGDTVNLEQSLRMNDRLDGHIVLGHVDCTGKIVSIKKEGNSRVFEIKVPKANFMKFLVFKGSIAIEGISLTITKVLKNSFTVKVLPYTEKNTNLKEKKKGDTVNLELDILAKYAYLSRTKFLITGNNNKNY